MPGKPTPSFDVTPLSGEAEEKRLAARRRFLARGTAAGSGLLIVTMWHRRAFAAPPAGKGGPRHNPPNTDPVDPTSTPTDPVVSTEEAQVPLSQTMCGSQMCGESVTGSLTGQTTTVMRDRRDPLG